MEGGRKDFFDLLNKILELSSYNMNQYTDGDNFNIPKDADESYSAYFEKMLNLAREASSDIEEGGLFDELKNIDDYKTNDKFFDWLKEYIMSVMQPYYDTVNIRQLSIGDFKERASFCFTYWILQDEEVENIPEGWDQEDLIVIKKVLYTAIEMIIVNRFGPVKTKKVFKEVFDFSPEFAECIINLIAEHKDELWKNVVMDKLKKIENE